MKVISVIVTKLCFVLKLLCWGMMDGERVVL